MAAIRPGRPPAKKQAAPAPQQQEAPPPPPPPAKNRNMTVPAIIVAVAVLGGAYFMKGGGGGGEDPATQAVSTPTALPAEEGEVVNLEPITLNLAGGDILKVGIALQLSADATIPEEELEEPAKFGARALDETIIVLGGYTRAELLAAGGLADAKAKLSERVAKLYHDAVVAVYFTQFVIA